MGEDVKINKNIAPLIILVIFFVSSCNNFSEKPKINAARFSTDGRHLIFSIEDKKGELIYRVDKDGTNLKRLTVATGRDDFPAYSPDGSKIVFSSSKYLKDDAPANLYIMDSDGSNKRCLTFGNQFDTFPVFSHDGKRIYFIRSFWYGCHSHMVHPFWQKEDVYSINIDGSDLKEITNGRYYDITSLSLFPDDEKILARIDNAGETSLFWMILLQDTKKMIPMSIDLKKFLPFGIYTYRTPYDPQLSRDGKCLLFVWSWEFKYDLYLLNLSDGRVRKITNLRSYILYPSFSSDGKEIVFLLDPGRNGNNQLWIVSSDGTNLKRVNIKFDNIK